MLLFSIALKFETRAFFDIPRNLGDSQNSFNLWILSENFSLRKDLFLWQSVSRLGISTF